MSGHNTIHPITPPPGQGLYDPRFEHDACGMGFIVNIQGKRSHQLVQQALTILLNLEHRGAVGSDPHSGDGAGILLQLPDTFLREVCAALKIDLPAAGHYGVGMVFLPPDKVQRQALEAQIEAVVAQEGQKLLGWRTVPTNGNSLGGAARTSQPVVRQFFVEASRTVRDAADPLAFERKLYLIRRRAENAVRHGAAPGSSYFHVASLSSRTLVYKGMLQPAQVSKFYLDLLDLRVESAICLVHSRFSTNTFPSWARAHPYRYMIHNGEINTLRGNVNWMRAREALMQSDVFGERMAELLPVIDEDGSDSAMFDNVLEFLYLNGVPLAKTVMTMIPEPWQKHQHMDAAKRAFYEFHACMMEPWDGPAAIAFTDGTRVGAVLDRNGLRPSRYYITRNDHVILSSEVGVLDIPPEEVVAKGRLQPGRMLLIDTAEQRIIADDEIKQQVATEHPYADWLADNLLPLEGLVQASPAAGSPLPAGMPVTQLQLAFGYSFEDLRWLMTPMIQKGAEALGSMGDDTPPAVLSNQSRLVYDYFKQLFAQVTNPPIDAIREELITATESYLGSDGNMLQPTPAVARRIKLPVPILTNRELAALRHVRRDGFRSADIPILFDPYGGGQALEQGLERAFAAADAAIADGANLLILTDRGISATQAGIPALLATAGLHHHLIRRGTRVQVSLIVESAEPREVHHFATLIGYGAEAINPYLAYATLQDILDKQLADGDYATAEKQYIKAVVKGVIKVLSKMGISTIQSYCGAQIFEALGLQKELVDRYFTGTASRIQGSDIDVIAHEVLARHKRAFPERPANGHVLPTGGLYQVRAEGEYHMYNPETVHALQKAVRDGDYASFKRFSTAVDSHERQFSTLRGLLRLRDSAEPIPLDEVESVDAIVRRFKTGAMSYGSISREAHETLAIAMNRIGARSNTGEGGEDPGRFVIHYNGDSRKSAIKQVASGRFGVTSEYLVNADEIQIKMAQGAKPGEGGQLPGHKVYPWIAKVRHSTPGVGLISPPPHHDIYSIEDLAQLIFDLKNANPSARINVKLVSEVGVGTVAAGVAKAHADVILISGADGGTGASPLTSVKHTGLPWELGLAETHQTLLLNDLRSRVRLETDGQLKTGRDVAIAALLGAEEFGFSTAPLISLGCIMMRVCHLNTCPVGIATQDPALRAKFAGEPQHVIHFMRFVAEELREIMARLGFRTVDEMVGRVDRLDTDAAIHHWKVRGIDLTPLLHLPDVPAHVGRRQTTLQDHGLETTLDYQVLLDLCERAIDLEEPVVATLPIRNTNRTVGTMVGSVISRRYGSQGLPDNSIKLHFQGSAGQSFGAFVPRGMTLTLEGDANDYFGKGLSGGTLVVQPPRGATFTPEENIIIGNVALYGATGGKAYIRGRAGERFAVRNSGVEAVVEGVGDHGCEYMTGGRVVVLGSIGRNFAAGMSGGVAYVLDPDNLLHTYANLDMVGLESVAAPDEIATLRAIIKRHVAYTGSALGRRILAAWSATLPHFVKVMPRDYKRMLAAIETARAGGLSGDDALLAAFEANMRDKARVGGN